VEPDPAELLDVVVLVGAVEATVEAAVLTCVRPVERVLIA